MKRKGKPQEEKRACFDDSAGMFQTDAEIV
jgi:hypothetical protein